MLLGDDDTDVDSIANDITAITNAAVKGYNAVTAQQLNQQLVARGLSPITDATSPEQVAAAATTSTTTLLLWGALAFAAIVWFENK